MNVAATLGRRAGWRRLALAGVLVLHGASALWFAIVQRQPSYFYDERYNLENVRSILDTGRLAPANSWYAPISYWPQTAGVWLVERLHQATGWRWAATRDRKGLASATGLLVVRLFSLAYGLAALFLTCRLGLRLFDPPVVLLGVLVVATVPAMIRVSAQFKPDALVLAAAMLTVVATLRAAERPGFASFALAGAALGLAAGAKLNGVFFAPIVGLAALGAESTARARRLLWLLAATAASIGSYFACSPFVRETFAYLSLNEKNYEWHGAGSSPGGTAALVVTRFAQPVFLGPLLGALAALGLARLAWRAFRSGATSTERLRARLVLAAPLVYLGGYVAATRYSKTNNLVEVVPYLGLAAADATFAGARWLSARLGGARRRRVAVVCAAAPVALVALVALASGVSFTYEENVATIPRKVAAEIRRRLIWVSPRVGIFAGGGADSPEVVAHRGNDTRVFLSWRAVPRLEMLAPERLDLADVEVFALPARGDPDAFLAARAARLRPEAEFTVRPAWFVARGDEALRCLFHPWEPVPPELEMPLLAGIEPSTLEATLPDDWAAGEVVAFRLALGHGEDLERLELEGTALPVLRSAEGPGQVELLTERQRLTRRAARVELRLRVPPADGADRPRLLASRWRPAAGLPPVP